MDNKQYENFQQKRSGSDNDIPPMELIDSTPDDGDIPLEIFEVAEEAKRDRSDD